MGWQPAVSGTHCTNPIFVTDFLHRFTVRNLKIDGAEVGVFASWNWGWTFQVGRLAAYISLLMLTTLIASDDHELRNWHECRCSNGQSKCQLIAL